MTERKRSPFDEAECGHHYGRAMASWSALLALTGFQYSGVTKEIKFGNITRKIFLVKWILLWNSVLSLRLTEPDR